jgi:hypothetical protein
MTVLQNLSLLLVAALGVSTPQYAHAADGKSFVKVIYEDNASGNESRSVYCAGFSGLRPTVTASVSVEAGQSGVKNLIGVPTGQYFEEFKMLCKISKKLSNGSYTPYIEGELMSCSVSALVNNDNSSEIYVKVARITTNGPLLLMCTVKNVPIERA